MKTPETIAGELTGTTRIGNFKELEIHLVNAREAPATMDEIGRIREREFRAVGAGRGGEIDHDRFDTQWPWYSQLVSWDPEEHEVVAMYRAIHCGWALRHGGLPALRTAELFRFSEEFLQDYLPRSVELGRSVVNRDARRALAGLFSVWTGLGAISREWSDVRYFFGNVSLYRTLPEDAVRRILRYLFTYHRVDPGLVVARRSAEIELDLSERDAARSPAEASAQQDALEALQSHAAAGGWEIPPILLSYLKAHPGMLAFDVARDDDFGGALEVAIAVPLEGVSPRTVKRFIDPYRSINPDRFLLPDREPGERP